MRYFRLILATVSLMVLNTAGIIPGFNDLPALAQRCGNTEAVKPSKTTKTVNFKKFGIKIKIPSNYKTMARQDGSLSILDPGSFEAVRCKAPHGLYSFNLKLLPNPNNLSLAKLARSSYSSYNGGSMKTYNYNRQKMQALLVDFEEGYSAYGIFKVPGIKGVVEMNASCDCEVNKQDIISYLKVTELIN
jgi:hypothetical protein